MSYIPPDGNNPYTSSNAPPNNAPVFVPNYLVWSIVLTVISAVGSCFYCLTLPALITGIIAIVFSTKVDSSLLLGDVQGALQASNTAKIMNWVTGGLIALLGLIFIAIIVFAIIVEIAK